MSADGIVQKTDHEEPIDDNSCKIFLGNLHANTDDDYKTRLKSFFEQDFGKVVEVNIIVDKSTGASRGFAFVIFADVEAANKVKGDHQFEGKTIQARSATRRRSSAKHNKVPTGSANSAGKVFVGGLPRNLDEEELRAYFQTYGEVKEAIILFDRTTKNSRGFGFVTFKEDEAVDELLSCQVNHELCGKVIEVKRATPRKDTPRTRKNFRSPKGQGARHILPGYHAPYFDQGSQPGFGKGGHYFPYMPPMYAQRGGFIPVYAQYGHGYPPQGPPMNGRPSYGQPMYPPQGFPYQQYEYLSSPPDHGDQELAKMASSSEQQAQQQIMSVIDSPPATVTAVAESLVGGSYPAQEEKHSNDGGDSQPSSAPLDSMGTMADALPQ